MLFEMPHAEQKLEDASRDVSHMWLSYDTVGWLSAAAAVSGNTAVALVDVGAVMPTRCLET